MPLLRTTPVLMLLVLAGYTGPFAFSGCGAAHCPFPVFQWVKIERDRSVVDVTELSAADEERVVELWRKYHVSTPDRGDTVPLVPEDETDVPKIARRGDWYGIVTEKGVDRRPVTGFGVGDLSDARHWLVYLEGSPGHAGLEGLALINGELPPGLQLRRPLAIDPSDPEMVARLRKILGQVKPLVPEKDQHILEKFPLNPETAFLVPGSFPAGIAALVSFTAFMRDEIEPFDQFSAVVLIDGQDRVIRPIGRPGVQLNGIKVYYVADLNSDGMDEIVLDDFYYEGGWMEILYWCNGQPYFQTINGGGL